MRCWPCTLAKRRPLSDTCRVFSRTNSGVLRPRTPPAWQRMWPAALTERTISRRLDHNRLVTESDQMLQLWRCRQKRIGGQGRSPFPPPTPSPRAWLRRPWSRIRPRPDRTTPEWTNGRVRQSAEIGGQGQRPYRAPPCPQTASRRNRPQPERNLTTMPLPLVPICPPTAETTPPTPKAKDRDACLGIR